MRRSATPLGAAVLAGGVLLGTTPAATAPGGSTSATPSVLSQHKAD